MSYLYSLPTTGAVRLSSLVSDPDNVHAADLARAGAARGRVRTALKEARRAEAANKDWAGCVAVRESCQSRNGFEADLWSCLARLDIDNIGSLTQALQEYLPHLLAIVHCLETDDLLLLKGEPCTSTILHPL